MDIIISSNTSKPIYEQITMQIKAMIMNGELQTGAPLPSMRSLAKSIHVSVITVQTAIVIFTAKSGYSKSNFSSYIVLSLP